MDAERDYDKSEARIADLIAIVRDTVRRRWLMLALVSLGIAVLGAFLVFQMPDKYGATTRIRIDPSRNPLATKASDGKAELTPEAIETEVSAIRSPLLAQAIVKKLGLVQDPEFAKALENQPGATTAEAREKIVADAVLDQLSVNREKLTYLIEVEFTSLEGRKSAAVANAFATGYIDAKAGNKAGTAESQSEWFKTRLAELSEEARLADEKVAQFRAANGLVESSASQSQGTLLDQQVAPLASALALAESDAAGARATLSAANSQIGRGGIDASSAVLSSDVISTLRAQRADIVRNMADVQARYGAKHPESVRAREQLSDIDGQIAAEARRVMRSLQANADSSSARADSLRSALSGLQAQRERDTRNAVIAESLEREAAAKRALYDRMAQLSLESTQAARINVAGAEIVEPAQAPLKPTSPNRPLLLALVLLVALSAGAGTITAQEIMSGGLRSVEEIESQFGLPVIAAIPNVPRNDNPADLLLDQPTSFYAEALRVARAAVIGVRSQTAPKVIALTSALPSEGKTTTALSFARALAIAKSRTLLIECDVRRAVIQRMVRVPVPENGLVEVLHGEATADETITPGDLPNLDHLLVTSKYFSSEDLFGEGAMENLLNRLRGRYDHIVLDLPPLMGLADGRFLAAIADVTILVVKWNETPRAAVSSALNFLRMDGSKPVGIILSMVDSSAESMGGLNYYSSKYAEYYSGTAS